MTHALKIIQLMESNLQYCGMLMIWIFIILTLRLLTLLSIYLTRNLVFMRHWYFPEERFTLILEWSLIISLEAMLYVLCLITPRMCSMSFRRNFSGTALNLVRHHLFSTNDNQAKVSPKEQEISPSPCCQITILIQAGTAWYPNCRVLSLNQSPESWYRWY